nr:MAG TPA: protein of unknown function (DUF5345) [Caudoviricetes sp.]
MGQTSAAPRTYGGITMYLYCGKRITREEKRRRQRLRANLIGVALAAALVVAGIILGLTAGARL